MAPKILLTGATGYNGGTVFDTLVTTHPEYDITVVLRNTPASFPEKYPNVKILRGDFDSSDLLRQAALESNIVVHNGNSDHESAVQALLDGLLMRASASLPSFYIHLSGAASIAQWDRLGESDPNAWSDVNDINAIWSLPAQSAHRHTEALIQETWTAHGDKIKTAIVSPPNIHGRGTGPGRVDSFFVPAFYEECLKMGATFSFRPDTNIYSTVHVEDVAQIFLKLVEAAAAGGQGADWGHDGYYFTTSEEIPQIDIASATGKILKSKGLLPTAEPTQISLEQLDEMLPHIPLPGAGRLVFGSNPRSRAHRAQKVLAYEPKGPKFLEILEEDLIRAAEGI